MIIVIGLVATGKTSLYRWINEQGKGSAVELELPQSCIQDNELCTNLFKLYYNNKNITHIIVHPYFLPQQFWTMISHNDTIILLNKLTISERQQRITQRSKAIGLCQSEVKIFPAEYLAQEEQEWEHVLEEYNQWIKLQ